MYTLLTLVDVLPCIFKLRNIHFCITAPLRHSDRGRHDFHNNLLHYLFHYHSECRTSGKCGRNSKRKSITRRLRRILIFDALSYQSEYICKSIRNKTSNGLFEWALV